MDTPNDENNGGYIMSPDDTIVDEENALITGALPVEDFLDSCLPFNLKFGFGDKETIAKMVNFCIENNSAKRVAKYVISELMAHGYDEEVVVRLTTACTKNGAYEPLANRVIPHFLIYNYDQETIIGLTNTCIENGAYEPLAVHVIPKLIRKDYDQETIIRWATTYIENGAYEPLAAHVIPELIRKGYDQEIIIRLATTYIANGVYEPVAALVIPELINHSFDQEIIIELTNICIENGAYEPLAALVMPELIRYDFDQQTIIEFTTACTKDNGISVIAQYVLPQLTNRKGNEEIVFELAKKSVEKGVYFYVGQSKYNSTILKNLIFPIGKPINSLDELITSLHNEFLSTSNRNSTFFQTLENNIRNDNGLKGLINNNPSLTKVVDLLSVHFVEAILHTNDSETIEVIRQNPKIMQVLGLCGIDFVTSWYGVKTHTRMVELLNNVSTTNPENENLIEDKVIHVQRIKQKHVLKEYDTHQIDVLNTHLDTLVANFNVKKLNLSSYSDVNNFVHDVLQEDLLKLEDLPKEDKAVISTIKTLLQDHLEENFETTSVLQMEKEGIPKTRSFNIRQAKLGSIGELLMGAVSNACYIGEIIPENFSAFFIETKEGYVAGGFLTIETVDENNNPLLILRATNPKENYAQTNVGWVKSILEYLVQTNPKYSVACIIDNQYGASTNRPSIFEEMKRLHVDGHLIQMNGDAVIPNATFNEYQITYDFVYTYYSQSQPYES